MVQSAVQPLATYSQGWGVANHTNLPRHEAQPNMIDHQTTMFHDVPIVCTCHNSDIAMNDAIGYTGATGGISFNDVIGQLGRIDYIHPQEPRDNGTIMDTHHTLIDQRHEHLPATL